MPPELSWFLSGVYKTWPLNGFVLKSVLFSSWLGTDRVKTRSCLVPVLALMTLLTLSLKELFIKATVTSPIHNFFLIFWNYSWGLLKNLTVLSEQPSHEQSITLYQKDNYHICGLLTWLCNNRRTLLQSQQGDKSVSSSANISQSYKNIICLFDCGEIYSHLISSPDCFCWTQ